MLITDERHQAPVFPLMWIPGTKLWRMVSLELRRPYYFVSYSCQEGRASLFQSSILSDEDDLLDFCLDIKYDSQREIHQVCMLLPDSQDRIGAWRLVTMKEVWSGVIRSDKTRAAVLIGIDGQRWVRSQLLKDASRVQLIDITYMLE